MKKIFLFSLYLIATNLYAKPIYDGCTHQLSEPVKEIVKGIPDDLKQSELLVPQYDAVPSNVPNAQTINRSVKEGNEEIQRILRKHYDGKYKMVSLKEVESMKAKGYKYLMDVVVMPKQFKEPKKEAMVSVTRKFKTANAMFANYDAQYHYYFYIRDLSTDNAYITQKFHGRFLAYDSMDEFFTQVSKEMGR